MFSAGIFRPESSCQLEDTSVELEITHFPTSAQPSEAYFLSRLQPAPDRQVSEAGVDDKVPQHQ